MSNVSLSGIPSVSMPSSPALDSGEDGGGLNFGDVLQNAVSGVDSLNNSAGAQIGSLLKGGGADMASVMIAVEKADASFQLMMQVRNKIVNAYQDIEKMQF